MSPNLRVWIHLKTSSFLDFAPARCLGLERQPPLTVFAVAVWGSCSASYSLEEHSPIFCWLSTQIRRNPALADLRLKRTEDIRTSTLFTETVLEGPLITLVQGLILHDPPSWR